MPESELTIYQSGQTVVIAGTYEVVGSKRRTKTSTGEFPVRELQVGEIFPNFEGRSVGWHMNTSVAQPVAPAPDSPQRPVTKI